MIRRVIIFSVLSLMANMAVASDQKTVSESDKKAIYDLQNKCLTSCKDYIFGYENVSAYQCHYNEKLSKCFIVIYSHSSDGTQVWQYLYDIGESKGYDSVSSVDIRACNIYIINHDTNGLGKCYANIYKQYEDDVKEFDKRIKPYMTE